MAEIRRVDGVATWLRAAQGARPYVVFKHSTTCPVSAAAEREFRMWAEGVGPDGPDLWAVTVPEQATLSRRIAADTGIAHRSPQVLYVRDGRVVWHASHGQITQASLRGAIG